MQTRNYMIQAYFDCKDSEELGLKLSQVTGNLKEVLGCYGLIVMAVAHSESWEDS